MSHPGGRSECLVLVGGNGCHLLVGGLGVTSCWGELVGPLGGVVGVTSQWFLPATSFNLDYLKAV